MGRRALSQQPVTARVVPERRLPRAVAAAFVSLAALAMAPVAGHSADWRITPGLSLIAIYTDNVDLAPPGEEQESFIGGIQPMLSVHGGGGGRIKLNFDWAPIIPRFSTDTGVPGLNDVRHNLQAGAKAELYENHLFLDATASAGQALTLSDGIVTTSSLTASPNTSQYYSYSLNPYWRQHFAGYGDMLLGYQYSDVLYDSNLSDSGSGSWNASFSSGREFPRLPWVLTYNREDVQYAGGSGPDTSDQTFESYDLSASYPINRLFALNASVGFDNNTYASGGDDTSGPSWSAGGTWTPSPRTSLSLGYGGSYWGDSWYFDLSHRSRRTVWTASYNESVTTSRDILLQQQLVPLVDPFGRPIVDPLTGQVFQVAIDTPTLNNQVLIQKTFQGSVALAGRRSSVTLSVYDTKWDYPASPELNQSVLGATVSLSHTLSTATTASLSGNWQPGTFTDNDQANYDYWGAWLTLSHQLSEHLSGSLTAGHQQQSSDDPNNDYEENRLGAFLTVTF